MICWRFSKMRTEHYVGVDGCRAGWFVIAMGRRGEADFKIVARISQLWDGFHAGCILIDIPIGLIDATDSGSAISRACDGAARKVLAPRRHGSVFSPPCRQALSAKNYAAACRINQAVCGRKISRQVWGIASKIREVDDFLQSTPDARGIFREAHPELCFWAMAEYTPMVHNKKSAAGQAERLDLLEQAYPPSPVIYEAALERYARKHLARDDILDALVNAVTAIRLETAGATLPESPNTDPRGLAMEMVYARP